MKTTCFLLLFAFCAASALAQSNPYEKARQIIQDRDSIHTPNGIQENFQLSIGGIQHSVYVRGYDKGNPIIFFVHGGPASPMSPVMWMFQKPIEEYFTVVHYDQRASGRTFALNDTLGLDKTIRIDQYVSDALELAEQIRKRYGKQKLILVGHSWGTILCMKAALQRPDLFHAYVGMGQVINVRDNEALSFQHGLEQARLHKNEKALEELESIAPYPGNQPITRERIIIARNWAQYYGGLTAYRPHSNYFFRAPHVSPEYTAEEVKAINQGNIFTLGRILPEFLEVNFKGVKKFPIPVFMFMGRHDYTTPSAPTEQWLKEVKAPVKKGVWFEHSSHMMPMEEPGKTLVSLLELVRPLALKGEL